MCGIGAISLSPTSKLPVRQLAHELLLHSEERGKVASGFGYTYGKQSFYVKDPKPGGHMPLKVLPKDARTVIIHTRNATFGDPEENDNNHPVVDDREEIILVHNGVITNHKAIRDGEKAVKFPEVDSAVLPWLIREYGADGLKHTDGWAAVAWLDQRAPGELNLARVKGAAPMVVLYLDDGSIVMGSTFPIVHASLINVGYGDRIVGGWEVPDLTHLRIANGTIVGIGNLTAYSQVTAKYRGVAMSYQEKQRLEKITNGDAVSYGKDNPVHAPSTQPSITKTTPSTTGTAHTPPRPQPSAGSLASAGITPGATATGSGVAPVKSTYSQPQTPRVQLKPGEDPMAAFKDAAAKTPPPSVPISYGTQGSYFESNRHSTRTIVPEHPIPMYLERRLRYWVSWEGDPTMTIDTDTLFIPSDFAEDKGYLFNIFMELVEDCESRGLLSQWGVFDHEGKPRDFSPIKTMNQVIEIMSSYAEKIGPKEERRAPKGGAAHGKPAGRSGSNRAAALDDSDDDDDDFPGMSLRDFSRNLGLTPNGNVFDKDTGAIIPMDQIEDHEWSQLIWAEEEEA